MSMLKTSNLKQERVMLNDLAKVRVSKREPDNLRSLAGEPVQVDDKSNEFFIIPAHLAEYIRKVFSTYTVSDEFLSDDVLEKLKEKKNEKKVEGREGEAETQPQAKRGNPNWTKKESNLV